MTIIKKNPIISVKTNTVKRKGNMSLKENIKLIIKNLNTTTIQVVFLTLLQLVVEIDIIINQKNINRVHVHVQEIHIEGKDIIVVRKTIKKQIVLMSPFLQYIKITNLYLPLQVLLHPASQ